MDLDPVLVDELQELSLERSVNASKVRAVFQSSGDFWTKMSNQ